MRRLLVSLLILALVVPVGSILAGGRPDKSWKSWFGQVAVGWDMPQGDVGDILDDDWWIDGGATYWPEAWPIGVNLDLAYSNLDVSSSAIDAINAQLPPGGTVTGGDVSIWALTVNGQWSPMKKKGGAGFYITAGIGGYYLDGRLTDTGIVYYPPVCDPWYWWCYPGGVGPGTYVKASDSSTNFGWNGGLGLTFEVGTGSQIYVEAKYHSIDTSRATTELVPIIVGFRW